MRLVRDGEPLAAERFTRTARTGRHRIDDLVEPARVLDLYAEGATIVLQSLQRWWPPISRFCRGLELSLGHPVQANAYLTPAGARGLAPHHDTHDVFVLQVAGTKHWTVREPLVAAPLPRHVSHPEAAAAQPVVLEADLAPGDTLYLPRGAIHSASAQAAASLHLTIGILAVTAHDVLRALVARAVDEDARFRRNLPLGAMFDGDAAARSVKALAVDMAAWLDQVDPGTVADEVRDRVRARRPPLLDGQLTEIDHLGAIDDRTVVRSRWGSLPDRRLDSEGLHVRVGDRTVHLPAVLDSAVALLLDGQPHAVADLAGLLDAPSRLVLVRRFVREGLLRTDLHV